mgnify:FL=1
MVEEVIGLEDARTCLKQLQKLLPCEIRRLQEVLTKFSLLTLEDYYLTGVLENTKLVSVPLEELLPFFELEENELLSSYIFGKDNDEEGYLPFFRPLGRLLEPLLPHDVLVSDESLYHFESDEVVIDFKVYKEYTIS